MGLGIYLHYPLEDSGKASKEGYEQFFRGLTSVIPDWEIKCDFEESGFRVGLVPFEEEVYGNYEDGELHISARTNSAGPGYHAYLVDILDRLPAAPLAVFDETDYYEHRDYQKLQDSMNSWLQGLSNALTQEGQYSDTESLSISLSLQMIPMDDEHFTCCPLGFFDRAFFEKAIKGESNNSEFFIWWNQETDALFYRNSALYLMWYENNWLAPVLDSEFEILRATLSCLEKAYSLSEHLHYPVAEWLELAELDGDPAQIQKAQQLQHKGQAFSTKSVNVKLGYRKGQVSSQIIGGWRLVHDGKMHFERDEDGTAIWWDQDRTVRVSLISLALKEGTDSSNESLLQSVIQDESGYESFALKNSEAAAAIQHSQITEEDGELCQQTRLFVALNNELLILSVYYPDKNNRDWATSICANLVC